MSRTGKFPLPCRQNSESQVTFENTKNVESWIVVPFHCSCSLIFQPNAVIMIRNTFASPKFSPSLEAKRVSPKCRQVYLTSVNFYHEILGHSTSLFPLIQIVYCCRSTEKTTRRAVNRSFYILYSMHVFSLYVFVPAMMLQNMLSLYSSAGIVF